MTRRQERAIGIGLMLLAIGFIVAWHRWDISRAYFIALSVGVEIGLAVLAVPLGIIWLVRRFRSR